MIDFVFDGISLSSFGYIVCSFDSIGVEKIPVSNSTFNTIKAPLSKSSKKVSIDDGENLKTTIQICKNTCNNNKQELSLDDISELTRWLCRSEYKLLQLIPDKNGNSDLDEVYYEAQITATKIMIGETCYGMELQVTTNRPYALTREIRIYNNISSGNSININIYSDDESYIYPEVVIEIGQSGDLIITNEYEGRKTEIKNCTKGEVISFYGDIMQIVSNDETHLIYNDFNYNFFRLCNKYKNSLNKISFSLDCNVTIKYRGIRKVGM